MNSYLISGLVLGLYAGLAPGPLFALIIAQTLKHNLVEGMKVAISPLLSDLPIILISILAISSISSMDTALGLVSLVAVIVDRFRNFLSSMYYLLTMKILGIVLFIFALFLFRDGFSNLF